MFGKILLDKLSEMDAEDIYRYFEDYKTIRYKELFKEEGFTYKIYYGFHIIDSSMPPKEDRMLSITIEYELHKQISKGFFKKHTKDLITDQRRIILDTSDFTERDWKKICKKIVSLCEAYEKKEAKKREEQEERDKKSVYEVISHD